jgi:MFS family permease
MSWSLAFWVHILAVLSLILAFICLPDVKPVRREKSQDTPKGSMTKSAWMWALTMFVLFIAAQVYSIYLAYIVPEKALGTSLESGNAMAFFAIGGFLLGIIFGKLAEIAKNLTLSVGLAGILVSYLLIAYAGSMAMIYAGAFIFGVALSICMPCIIVGTAGAVSIEVSGMAIAITMCAQNLAQFICPFILNPLSQSLGNGSNNNQLAFLMGAALTAVMLVIAVIWGIKENRTAA